MRDVSIESSSLDEKMSAEDTAAARGIEIMLETSCFLSEVFASMLFSESSRDDVYPLTVVAAALSLELSFEDEGLF